MDLFDKVSESHSRNLRSVENDFTFDSLFENPLLDISNLIRV